LASEIKVHWGQVSRVTVAVGLADATGTGTRAKRVSTVWHLTAQTRTKMCKFTCKDRGSTGRR